MTFRAGFERLGAFLTGNTVPVGSARGRVAPKVVPEFREGPKDYLATLIILADRQANKRGGRH